jgi:hypothetical protein
VIQPRDVAVLALFLCGEDAKAVTMENISVTGGALW